MTQTVVQARLQTRLDEVPGEQDWSNLLELVYLPFTLTWLD